MLANRIAEACDPFQTVVGIAPMKIEFADVAQLTALISRIRARLLRTFSRSSRG
jgi:hypothetical protein